ncbi:hypothetical protein L596_030848 [Steinernema carpocapsae]|uniref:Uncharacterized protein n=1 Tax=Steinernema carpocapsae TaxID=34508 RepID=A0A4U5LNC5_STECR|nr:hypothetical protein L596_030848 [Steinernema carpocapsae]
MLRVVHPPVAVSLPHAADISIRRPSVTDDNTTIRYLLTYQFESCLRSLWGRGPITEPNEGWYVDLRVNGQKRIQFELKHLQKDFENRVGWAVITALRKVPGPETVIKPDAELNAQAPPSRNAEDYLSEM